MSLQNEARHTQRWLSKSGLWFLVEINMASPELPGCLPGGAFHTSAQGRGAHGDHNSSLSGRDQRVGLGQARVAGFAGAGRKEQWRKQSGRPESVAEF